MRGIIVVNLRFDIGSLNQIYPKTRLRTRLLLRCCCQKTRPAMWSCLGETEMRWRVVRNLRFDVVDSVGRLDLQCGRVAMRQTR